MTASVNATQAQSGPASGAVGAASSPGAAEYAAQALALGADVSPTATLRWGSDPRQSIEIFAPPPTRSPRPVLTFFHGGAWIAGGLDWIRFMARAVHHHGAILVGGTYRLAPAHRWPEPYLDVCRTLDFVHERIADFGGDPGRHVVAGHSAGGHLASLAVLREDVAPVLACFPLSTPLDLQYGDVPADSPEGRVYRFLFARREQDFKASPINFVAGNVTPFHLAWGASDFARILRSGQRMFEALQGAGCPVSMEVMADCDHFGTHLALHDPTNGWYARLVQAWG